MRELIEEAGLPRGGDAEKRKKPTEDNSNIISPDDEDGRIENDDDDDSNALEKMHINGFASISYRLSAHPSFPQDLSSTPAEQVRQAEHPDHIIDVLMALKHLQNETELARRYVLVGHSCGATLAWQAVMAMSQAPCNNNNNSPTHWHRCYEIARDVVPPLGVFGLCGIYNLPQLVNDNKFKHIPAYREFATGAFGPEEDVWRDVSPAAESNRSKLEDWWQLNHVRRRKSKPPSSDDSAELGSDGQANNTSDADQVDTGPELGGRVVVLAHTPNDELVDSGQIGNMVFALCSLSQRRPKGEEGKQKASDDDDDGNKEPLFEQQNSHPYLEIMNLSEAGSHDEVWQDGRIMARVIRRGLELLAQQARAKYGKERRIAEVAGEKRTTSRESLEDDVRNEKQKR